MIGLDGATAQAWRMLASPPAEPMLEWNRRHGFVPDTETDKPGRWSDRSLPHLGHWHRVLTARLTGVPVEGDPLAHKTEQVYLVWGAQCAKTRGVLIAGLTWACDQAPRSIGYVMDRIQDLRTVQRTRIRPTFEQSARLRSLLPASSTMRRERLNARIWQLDRAHVHWLVGSVANDLRMLPLELLLLDEFDVYPLNVEDQGDPLDLLLVRQRGFPHTRLLVGVSTPTSVHGHAWRRLCSGSHERPLVPCPHCGAALVLTEDLVRWPEGATAEALLSGLEAWMECPWCQGRITTDQKDRALARQVWVPGRWAIDDQHPDGHWTPAAEIDGQGRLRAWEPPRTVVRSGWLSSLYSRDVSLGMFAAKLLRSQVGSDHERRTFLNTECCRPYLVRSVSVDIEAAAAELQAGYVRGALPPAVLRDQRPDRLILTADQQGNSEHTLWFPWVLRAWWQGGRSALVDCGRTLAQVPAEQRGRLGGLAELEEILSRAWMVGDQWTGIDAVWVDNANGNMTSLLRRWASGDPAHRRLLIGDARLQDDVPWAQVVPSKRQKHVVPEGVSIHRFHPNLWKDALHARITRAPLAPEWSLPSDCPAYYLGSLTSEEQVEDRVRVLGQGYQLRPVWRPRVVQDPSGRVTERSDTHWWDAEVMQLVAADLLGLHRSPEPVAAAPVEDREPERGGWIDTGRGDWM